MNPEHFKTLVHAYLDGALSPLQKLELEEALRDSAEHRTQFWKQTELHGQLRGGAKNEAFWRDLEQASEIQTVSSRSRGWLRNPMAAAAAGFALCLLCTSSVRAYMGQWVSKVRPLPLVNGGFEGSSEIGTSVPTKVGVWSGDFSRVTGLENGLEPHGGERMLRFLRADNVLSKPGGKHNVSEVLQVIDLRGYQAELKTGNAQVELSARFASAIQEPGYHFSLRAVSFSMPIHQAAIAWKDRGEFGRTSAERRVEAMTLSPTPKWQRIQLSLPILPETDFLIIQCAATREPWTELRAVEFPAHYLDEVTAQLRVNRMDGDL